MIAVRRRIFQIGGSKGVTLPGGRIIGDEVSMAANRLLLMDTTGEIPEDALLEFLNEEVEPRFWEWWKARKQPAPKEPAGFRPTQAEGLAQAKPVKMPEPTPVSPQTQFLPVICPRCTGHISWNTALGLEGFCPHCGIFLRLTS